MYPRTGTTHPHKRKGFWYLVRRVPKEFQSHDSRRLVMISTGIRIVDDPRGHSAKTAVTKLDQGLLRYWRDLKLDRQPDAKATYQRNLETAREFGLPYAAAPDVAGLQTNDILRRVEILDNKDSVQTETTVSAVLGGEDVPPLTLSGLRAAYEDIIATAMMQKSPNQKQAWRVRRDSAVDTFMELLGSDRPITTLTRFDILKLRSHWQARVLNGEISTDTANKNIGRIAGMFNALNDSNMLGLQPIFSRTAIRGGRTKKRVAYDTDFVQRKILAPNLFHDINEEARRIIYLIVETGIRLSEACNLNETTIILKHRIPHIQVRPDGREMKTIQSERDIPLVGVALIAMRAQPRGFPRYHDKANTLSAVINAAFDARGLKPKLGQSLYSLRHTFHDRLLAKQTHPLVIDNLMGHKSGPVEYGQGPSLEHKAKVLKSIAFRPPPSV